MSKRILYTINMLSIVLLVCLYNVLCGILNIDRYSVYSYLVNPFRLLVIDLFTIVVLVVVLLYTVVIELYMNNVLDSIWLFILFIQVVLNIGNVSPGNILYILVYSGVYSMYLEYMAVFNRSIYDVSTENRMVGIVYYLRENTNTMLISSVFGFTMAIYSSLYLILYNLMVFMLLHTVLLVYVYNLIYYSRIYGRINNISVVIDKNSDNIECSRVYGSTYYYILVCNTEVPVQLYLYNALYKMYKEYCRIELESRHCSGVIGILMIRMSTLLINRYNYRIDSVIKLRKESIRRMGAEEKKNIISVLKRINNKLEQIKIIDIAEVQNDIHRWTYYLTL
ncbi:hypothetical protein NEOKW01_0157 [Nematocida sp. AWRm80]|nr:hypothetical protein NEOKW01_0157 [Nematocida sp. AWRm80]